MVSYLSSIKSGSIQDKVIVRYTRKSGKEKDLVYSSLKLHELYKLPNNIQLDVLLNTNYSLSELRVENLENSDYFKVASATSLSTIINTLSTSALGYNGILYYFAYSPIVVNNTIYIDVPHLYRINFTAFKYDNNGKYIGQYDTIGPTYTIANQNTKFVEFIYDKIPVNYGKLYEYNESTTLKDAAYKLLSAYFTGIQKI
jgi:hypothetical protein